MAKRIITDSELFYLGDRVVMLGKHELRERMHLLVKGIREIQKSMTDDKSSAELDELGNEETGRPCPPPEIPDFRITDVLGRGGMGSVWQVRHEGWNAVLAMKRPQKAFFEEAGLSVFLAALPPVPAVSALNSALLSPDAPAAAAGRS